MTWVPLSGPSPHLSWKELSCKDGTAYPKKWRKDRASLLAQAFEEVRTAVGHPLRVVSAYRTPEWNRKVGGAKRSQHVEGRALDLLPPKDWTLENFYRVVHAVAMGESSPIYGLGKYPTFVHIDVRPSWRLVVWHGSRAWAEVKA